MVKFLAPMKASNWDIMKVKCLTLYLDISMKSHLVLVFEQSWSLLIVTLMVLMMAILRAY